MGDQIIAASAALPSPTPLALALDPLAPTKANCYHSHRLIKLGRWTSDPAAFGRAQGKISCKDLQALQDVTVFLAPLPFLFCGKAIS